MIAAHVTGSGHRPDAFFWLFIASPMPMRAPKIQTMAQRVRAVASIDCAPLAVNGASKPFKGRRSTCFYILCKQNGGAAKYSV